MDATGPRPARCTKGIGFTDADLAKAANRGRQYLDRNHALQLSPAPGYRPKVKEGIRAAGRHSYGIQYHRNLRRRKTMGTEGMARHHW